ncbi:hypothetical protein CD30_07465 [Ureibacillus massiliensis 4400831 = CIP 108448 = CCUG 49529]|uniref:Tripartite ATP-independent periplasmic transporters DctQ component domain-containing protein n=1 Tax=Ureibacillus massiliensis 4400831 = CIP 108448 = CCUG 49529 TaxID=1211035 RepID=A0A0A3J7C8_9BACL|nr:TRAP transporter small permease [Ureibacillus massiliensis]KGR91098.1 hypothetical protein CD30_07465 [Ureibacillus massiliensis 4400831 = CIP 108448 = CCUG 49529]
MNTFLKFQKKLELWLMYLGGALLIVLMIVISMESILRKFVNFSIPGIFEIAGQLMVGVTLLGISLVQADKEHISVDIFNDRLPKIVIKITDILIYLLGIGLTSIFAYQGFWKFIESFQTGETAMGLISIPFWPGRLIVFLAMTVLCLRFLMDLIILIFDKSKNIETESSN